MEATISKEVSDSIDDYYYLADERDPYKSIDDKTLKQLKKLESQEYTNSIELAKNHIGHESTKQFLYDSVVFYLDHQKEYQDANIAVNKGILLYGMSGTGKSSLAKECAKDIQNNYVKDKIIIIEIQFHDLASQKVSGASEKIADYFNNIKRISNFKILIMDEMESLAPVRHNAGVLALERTDALLKNIDDLPNTFIFGMSNHKEKIDPAMLREGRLGEVIEIVPPTEDERKLFILKWLNNGDIRYESNVDLNIFSKGYNIVGADYRYLQNKLFTLYLKNKNKPLNLMQVCKIQNDFVNKLNARG